MSKDLIHSEKKICLVDDVPENIDLLEIYLGKIGYENIVTFSAAKDCLDYLETESSIPDLFILDIMMPKIDGISLSKKINENPKCKYSSIIFATAKNPEEVLEECFNAGGNDFISKPIIPTILKCRLNNLFTIQNLLSDLIAENQNLSHKSLTDSLTQVYNRSFLDSRLVQEVSKSKRYENKLCAMMLDIDFFKKVNDTYGHPVGDEVLKTVAHYLKTSLRSSDLIARYGGEEFFILMPNTQTHEASNLAERLREKVSTIQVSEANPEMRITVSIGLADFHKVTESADQFLSECDKALYTAKQNGRNRVEIFKP
jgi:two-component system, cell cycle response regulator